MPTKKKTPAPASEPAFTGLPAFESGDPVIYHLPDMPLTADVPARDLNAADLEYIARVRALRASGGEPVAAVTADEIEALADELAASGAFTRTQPEPPADPAKES